MSNESNSIDASEPKRVDKAPPQSVAFVHNFLDEYELDPYEFRLYAHIVRRTGGKPNGICFSSVNTIARICKMSPRKVQQTLKVLIAANLITQTKRAGRTDEYRVRPSSDWVTSEQLNQIRENLSPSSSKKSLADKDLEPDSQSQPTYEIDEVGGNRVAVAVGLL